MRTYFNGIISGSLLFCVGILTGCGDPSAAPLPTFAAVLPATQVPARPNTIVQFCNDDTTNYPRQDFNAANALMASSLVNAVRSNQNGIKLYATSVTHNTFDPSNTLNPVFTIPAIPAYPAPPIIAPTPTQSNPVTYYGEEATVITADNSVVASYNAQVQAIDKQIQSQVDTITQDVTRLKNWNPAIDDLPTSITGCFAVARSNFINQTGTKLVYIASDLKYNTSVDFTPEFISSHGLDGVVVHVIFYFSENAVSAQEKINQWCPFLKAAGAKGIIFDERAKSATLNKIDLFTADASVTDKPC